ncbi:hypothetical protein HMPREF1325_2160 [Treponema socranskii subsp. socranskii VPI DR56BR1116 = ATCC 35536]|uniref:Uncharacterized protein n=1 Tax=Treponema socranskii subsp. socranskii VPI DR56BR1116 = ATCC 35536 TaxID=1125725 RepID=U1FNC1_TRESO|nr:hypothetical protein HMPREF1325_2160 [Treponema socranskii subsp. socranskii VPI DR56BR1116 = ATCC 35536]
MRGNDNDGFFFPRPYSCGWFNTPTLASGLLMLPFRRLIIFTM